MICSSDIALLSPCKFIYTAAPLSSDTPWVSRLHHSSTLVSSERGRDTHKGRRYWDGLDVHFVNNPVKRVFQHVALVLQFNSLVCQCHRCDILSILEKVLRIGNGLDHTRLDDLDHRVA